MNTMSAIQVQVALETLDTSYTYDPPNRWMASYRALRQLHNEMDEWLRLYAWIMLVCFALGLACFVLLAFRAFSSPIGAMLPTNSVLLDSIFNAGAWSLPIGLMIFGPWLSLKIAARRFPLLSFKARIEEATKRFHGLAGEPDLEEQV
jgi:hypothetical protein